MMQTEADAARLRDLGMESGKIAVTGSLKFDAGVMPHTDSLTEVFRERFRFTEERPLIVAASTHAPEERMILEAVKQITSASALRPRLLIAPRHPERFAEVAALITASGLRWSRRTAPRDAADSQSDVILLDSIGELQSVYPLASLVFVGGSIANNGGHNILEPAAAGACVITGANTHNFRFIVERFVEAGALVQLPKLSASEAPIKLAHVMSELLTDPAKRNEYGKRAQSLVNENRGATERTLDLLESVIPNASIAFDEVDSLRIQSAPTA